MTIAFHTYGKYLWESIMAVITLKSGINLMIEVKFGDDPTTVPKLKNDPSLEL